MKALDRIFGWILFLGGIGHGFGSWQAFHAQPITLIWALATSFAIFLLASLNLLRSGRPGDRNLAWTSFAGCLVWLGFSLWFGALIGHMLDFRPLVNALLSLILAGFSLRTALGAGS